MAFASQDQFYAPFRAAGGGIARAIDMYDRYKPGGTEDDRRQKAEIDKQNADMLKQVREQQLELGKLNLADAKQQQADAKKRRDALEKLKTFGTGTKTTFPVNLTPGFTEAPSIEKMNLMGGLDIGLNPGDTTQGMGFNVDEWGKPLPTTQQAEPTADQPVFRGVGAGGSWEPKPQEEQGFLASLLTPPGVRPTPIKAPTRKSIVDLLTPPGMRTNTLFSKQSSVPSPDALTLPVPAPEVPPPLAPLAPRQDIAAPSADGLNFGAIQLPEQPIPRAPSGFTSEPKQGIQTWKDLTPEQQNDVRSTMLDAGLAQHPALVPELFNQMAYANAGQVAPIKPTIAQPVFDAAGNYIGSEVNGKMIEPPKPKIGDVADLNGDGVPDSYYDGTKLVDMPLNMRTPVDPRNPYAPKPPQNPAFEKALVDQYVSGLVDTTSRMQTLDNLAAINDRSVTGFFKGRWNSWTQDPRAQEFESSALQLAKTFRMAGEGTMSDRDVRILIDIAPGMNKSKEANDAIIKRMRIAGEMVDDAQNFINHYVEKGGSIVEAKRLFNEYKKENPYYRVNDEKENAPIEAMKREPIMSWYGKRVHATPVTSKAEYDALPKKTSYLWNNAYGEKS